MILSQRVEGSWAGGRRVVCAFAVGCAMAMSVAALRAETASYPFEGTWVRSDRICSPASPHVRTYTGRDLSMPGGHCVLRKVAFGSGEFELFEECRRAIHPGNVTEKIRMLGPDMMMVKQQVKRLKIPRGRRFTRCTAAALQAPTSAKPASRAVAAPPAAAKP